MHVNVTYVTKTENKVGLTFALILYRRRRFINHLLTYLLTYL